MANTLPAPWNSDTQQLLKFAYGPFSMARSRADIFGIFGWVTSQAPRAADAWFADARIHAFIGDWKRARESYRRALALNPNDEVIRRFVEVAARQP